MRLCNTLTSFYMKCKVGEDLLKSLWQEVLGEEAQSSRLLLCEATRKALRGKEQDKCAGSAQEL